MAGSFLRVFENGVRGARPKAERRADFKKSHLEVRMFNVGAGEAILLIFPNGRCWLVDGGSSNSKSRNKTLGAKLAAYIKKRKLTLEALVASHPHADHVGAVRTLLAGKPKTVSKLLLFRSDDSSWKVKDDGKPIWLQELRAELAELGPKLVESALKDAHHELRIDDDFEAHLFAGSGDGPYTSIFLQLRFRDARLLFTGDAHCGYEIELLERYGEEDFRADVLKVTHHGSSSGTAQRVVDTAKPGVAIASVANDAGHRLEADTLGRLGGRPGPRRILETVVDGDIILRTDGLVYGKKGILYRLELNSPGQFSTDVGATVLPLATVDGMRQKSVHKDCN